MNATTWMAWLASGLVPYPTRVCSVEYLYWVRHEPAQYVIVVATADSAPAALWRPDTSDFPRSRAEVVRPARPRPTPVVVWGQVAHVARVSSDPRTPTHSLPRSATVIQWAGKCSREPGHALWMDPGDTVFIPGVAERPDSLPPSLQRPLARFETFWGLVTYSPQRARRAHPGVPVLTLGEFESLYNALPTIEAWHRDPTEAVKPLWRWVAAHPSLAKRIPARAWIAVVRAELLRAERGSKPPGA